MCVRRVNKNIQKYSGRSSEFALGTFVKWDNKLRRIRTITMYLDVLYSDIHFIRSAQWILRAANMFFFSLVHFDLYSDAGFFRFSQILL